MNLLADEQGTRSSREKIYHNVNGNKNPIPPKNVKNILLAFRSTSSQIHLRRYKQQLVKAPIAIHPKYLAHPPALYLAPKYIPPARRLLTYYSSAGLHQSPCGPRGLLRGSGPPLAHMHARGGGNSLLTRVSRLTAMASSSLSLARHLKPPGRN